ncbi:hypothetical protein BJF85_04235 [Saccharomonospora sp. CUA-673]|uniref:Zn-ribbon domain-containing OB-fold protein n=1 Tax=Saccharomonospora sp. CUA-673 TaxID=1904969 RepID=UPI00096360D8|nr:OB-fold domain-containing protein [Saccharomonospora sp. CUA-673]OLT41646.1 hypothetical protein BJF85_04235 [Saccharomonospora sp. CUA-673]
MTTQTALREDTFRETPDGFTLLASRCHHCGHVSFPPATLCVACRAEALKPIDLGGRAELLCSTTVHMPSEHFAAGYTVGYVTMPGGQRIFTPLAPADDTPLTPGMPLKLEIAAMWQDDGTDIVAHRFVPDPA